MLSLSQPLQSQYPHQPHEYRDIPRQHQQQLSRSQLAFEYPSSNNSNNNTLTSSTADGSNPLVSVPDTLPIDAMQAESWPGLAQYGAPRKQLGHGRIAHQRESSLSSLGSTGPASPFNPSTSNPQIAVTDSTTDGLSDIHSQDAGNGDQGYYQLAKSVNGHFAGYQHLDQALPEMAYPLTIPGPNNSKPRVERGLLPAPELSGSANRSHPTSVASSIAGDSPATPTVGDMETVEKRRKEGYGNVPRLDRTMTDIYSDELYNPNFAITSTPPQQPQLTTTATTSPPNDIFNQRLNAANIQHLTAGHSPASATPKDRSSPFRMGSPHAMAPQHDFGASQQQRNGMQFNSAQRMREQSKAQQDVQMFQQQMNGAGEPETPKTISPKDAILEFNEPEGDANFPLFGQDPGFDVDLQKTIGQNVLQELKQPHLSLEQNGVANQGLQFMPSQLATTVQMPQQYPFVPRTQPKLDSPPRLSSAGSSTGSSGNTPANLTRPTSTTADGGTYTCTYHGCTLRFETPALLQKHKREGHRQTHGMGMGMTRPLQEVPGLAPSLLNSQAGPHRCDRINPSTGKPCSTVFSRPYDLTRHEDTIHNARKQKVRCDLCTEEKTFSRADALTRHYRVCHPEMELPGKHRRRGGV